MPFGGTEMLIVLGVVVLFFGGTKIPQPMRGVGEGVRELRQSMCDGDANERREDQGLKPDHFDASQRDTS